MNNISLSDYVAASTQEKTAKELGVTQGAIGKALRSHRKIRVVSEDGVAICAYEYKLFGKKS